MAWAGMKRSAMMPEATPTKAPRGPDASDTNQWTCGKCGNVNYGNRLVCNMRKCGAPRSEEPWICPGCGNENFANRMFCNMRRCQLARPGLTATAMKQATVSTGKGGGGKGGGPKVVGPPMAPVGEWMCPACGNKNFAGRTHCNMRSCGQPAPGAMAPMLDFARLVQGLGMGVTKAKGGGKEKAPQGSWVCVACNNVNYPMRTTCNGKNCGQPRASVDGGDPSAPNDGPIPTGSWVCPACQNVNYPQRTSCNRHTCGQPRPAHL